MNRTNLRLLAGLAFALLAGFANAQQAPSTAAPVVATSGNVAAATATATLPAAGGRTTYICGLAVTGLGATAGSSPLATVSNLAATFSFNVGVPAGVAVPIYPVFVNFVACQPANAPNTAIAVSVPSFGSGNTNASVIAWGYQAASQ